MLTVEEARRLFSYNKKTGVLKWRKRINGRIRIDRIAGCIWLNRNTLNIRVRVKNRNYQAHRIIFLIVTGAWPPEGVDHINGVGTDNRWKNIRLANHMENGRNARQCSTNTSGCTGVCFDVARNKWTAGIKLNGKLINLGRFTTIEEAISVRKKAERKYGFHANHGRKTSNHKTIQETL